MDAHFITVTLELLQYLSGRQFSIMTVHMLCARAEPHPHNAYLYSHAHAQQVDVGETSPFLWQHAY